MSRERPQPATTKLGRTFGFTEREELYNWVSDHRFRDIVEGDGTVIHEIEETYNNYGEFLFVTVSRRAGERRVCVSFYGYGYHEYRERWYTDEWHFYRANSFPDRLERRVPLEKAQELIDRRRTAIAPYVKEEPQSERAQLYELLAELTDDDGALVELEDLRLLSWFDADTEDHQGAEGEGP